MRDNITEIRKIGALDYLLHVNSARLKSLNKKELCLVDHPSLKFSNGLWHWFSHQFGGRSALDFLIKVDNYTYKEATMILEDFLDGNPTFLKNLPAHTKKRNSLLFYLPLKANNNNNAINYLINRGIHFNIINYCIKNSLIYESLYFNYDTSITNTVTFLGYDENSQPRYACSRGIDSDFLQDSLGSNKRYAFKIIENINSTILHVFESPIDTLSFISKKVFDKQI